MSSNVYLLLTLLVVSVATVSDSGSRIAFAKHIFLVEEETTIVQPHRLFKEGPPLGMQYTAIGTSFQYYAALPMISTILASNVAWQLIDMYFAGSDSVFTYCRLKSNGVLSSVMVNGNNTIQQYQIPIGNSTSDGIMVDPNSIFLWNSTHYMLAYYNMIGKRTNKQVIKFPRDLPWRCDRYAQTTVACWDISDQISYILLITIINQSLTTNSIPLPRECKDIVMVKQIQEPNIFVICWNTICTLFDLVNSTLVQLKQICLNDRILKASYNQLDRQLVLSDCSSLSVYIYTFSVSNFTAKYDLQLHSTTPYPGFTCDKVGQAKGQNGYILLECTDEQLTATTALFVYDAEINRYNALQLNISKGSMVRVYHDQLIIVRELDILIRATSCNYFRIKYQQSWREIIIVGKPSVGESVLFSVSVTPVTMDSIYIDRQLPAMVPINYNQRTLLSLKQVFKGNSVSSFHCECPLFDSQVVQKSSIVTYFSLFNKQNCIQVLHDGKKMVYRLLQVEDGYYVEECSSNGLGYGCLTFSVWKSVQTLSISLLENSLLYVFYQEGRLLVQSGCRRVEVEGVMFQNQKQVSYYRLIDDWGLELTVSGDQVYIVFLDWLLQINNKADPLRQFIRKDTNSLYYYEQNCLIISSLVNSTLTIYKVNEHKIINIPAWEGKMQHTLELEEVIVFGDYLFIVNQTHIAKRYFLNTSILVYSFKYNPCNLPIESIHLTGQYLIVQYCIKQFEVYDLKESVFALLVLRKQLKTIKSAMLTQDSSLLIPIKQDPIFVKLPADPYLEIGPLPLDSSQLIDTVRMTITPRTSALLKSSTTENPSQTLQLNVSYQPVEITLKCTSIKVLQLPYSCSNCQSLLNQSQFKGPIFQYYLSDEFDGQLRIRQHLVSSSCPSISMEQYFTNSYFKVNYFMPISQSFLMFGNTSHLLLVNEDATVDRAIKLPNDRVTNCLQYIIIANQLVIVCNMSFLIVGNENIAQSIPHPLEISDRDNWQMDWSVMDSNTSLLTYYIYLVHAKQQIHIFTVCTDPSISINWLRYISLSSAATAFRVIIPMSIVLTLNDSAISVYTLQIDFIAAYSLRDIIPAFYATTYSYSELITFGYYLLLFSNSSQNTHMELRLKKVTEVSFAFDITNAYAGFLNYEFARVIAVSFNQKESLSHMIIQMKHVLSHEFFIVYYQYNQEFATNKTIGNIKFAEQLQDVLYNQMNLHYAPFQHRLWISDNNEEPDTLQNSTRSLQANKMRHCILYEVYDDLLLLMNYQEPIMISYIVIHARNSLSSSTLYTKILFEKQQLSWYYCFLGFPIVALIFIGLACITNRCLKDSQMDNESGVLQYYKQPKNETASDSLIQSSTAGANSNLKNLQIAPSSYNSESE